MKKISLYTTLFAFALFLAACGQKEEEKESPNNENQEQETEETSETDLFNLNICDGTSVINGTTSYEDLVEIYGEENLGSEVRLYAEGTMEHRVTLIYPGTDNELVIVWNDEEARKFPMMIEANIAGSEWYTVDGIQVGTSMETLAELNGNEFTFSGFGWDYGGNIISWQGGNYETEGAPCFNATLGYDYNQQAPDEVFGDIELSSDDPNLEGLGVQVVSFNIFFS